MSKISFADAAADFERICDTIDNLDEIGPLVTNLFEKRQQTFAEKVDFMLRARWYLESQVEHSHAMIEDFQKRCKALTRSRDSLNQYVLMTMRASPDLEFRGKYGGFRIQKSPKRLVLDETKLPASFFKEEILRKPDKEKILEAIVAGEEISGASQEQGEHVRITKEMK